MSGLLAGWCDASVIQGLTIVATNNAKGDLMSQKRIQQIERRIDRIKTALMGIGPMRPGSLTRQ